MMLYKDVTVIAMIAGIEYCINNLPIGSVPKDWVFVWATTNN